MIKMGDGQVLEFSFPKFPTPNHGKCHTERFKELLDTGNLSDLQLEVGSGSHQELFQVHKLILSIGSPVLNEIISKSTDDKIKIEGETPEIFLLFLKFLYTGESHEFKVEVALPLLRLAVTYKVFDLFELCKDLLREDLTDENAVTLFQQAIRYNEEILVQKALQYICRNAWSIIETDEFIKLNPMNLKKLLMDDRLLPLNETQLVRGLLQWNKMQCLRQEISENSYFPLHEFLQFIFWERINCKVIDGDELISQVEKLFNTFLHINAKQTIRNKQRAYFEDDTTLYTVSRLPQKFAFCCDNKSKDWESICFKVDKSICLVSIGIPAYSQNIVDGFRVAIKIEEDDYSAISNLHQQQVEVDVPHSTGIYHITFPRPQKIKKETWYTISGCISGAAGYGNTGGKASVTMKCFQSNGTETQVKFEFRNAHGNHADISGGQLDELVFKLAEQ